MNAKKPIVECEQLTQPYDGRCECRAISTCRKCKKKICFDHSYYHCSWEELCWDCYKEVTR